MWRPNATLARDEAAGKNGRKLGRTEKRDLPENGPAHTKDRNWSNDTIDGNTERDRRLSYLCGGGGDNNDNDNDDDDDDEGDDFRESRMLLANEVPDETVVR